jgi:hypothetical protein
MSTLIDVLNEHQHRLPEFTAPAELVHAGLDEAG